MENCIFCRIVREGPDYKVYEDKNFLGMLDVFPRTKGHTILIPKKHYRWTYDVPEFGEYWETARKITRAMLETLHSRFVTYVTHGLEVEHAHIHIMPRQKETEFVPDKIQVPKEEMEQIAKTLRDAIS